MAYHPTTQQRAKDAKAKTLDERLLQAATRLEFSVIRIAACTGATRQTVYQWYKGRNVSAAYAQRVEQLLRILETAKNADRAWSTACKKFSLTV